MQKVPYSNLILLVVDTTCPCGNKQLSITSEEIIYDNKSSNGCLHKPKDSLYRRRPPKCINYHPEVSIVEWPYCSAFNFAILTGNRNPCLRHGSSGYDQHHDLVDRFNALPVRPFIVIIKKEISNCKFNTYFDKFKNN